MVVYRETGQPKLHRETQFEVEGGEGRGEGEGQRERGEKGRESMISQGPLGGQQSRKGQRVWERGILRE